MNADFWHLLISVEMHFMFFASLDERSLYQVMENLRQIDQTPLKTLLSETDMARGLVLHIKHSIFQLI